MDVKLLLSSFFFNFPMPAHYFLKLVVAVAVAAVVGVGVGVAVVLVLVRAVLAVAVVVICCSPQCFSSVHLSPHFFSFRCSPEGTCLGTTMSAHVVSLIRTISTTSVRGLAVV